MVSREQIAVAAIFKDEAPYIIEWIAWHKVIGFDKFIIADNESSDSTQRILKGLEKQGIVEYFSFPSRDLKSPQLAAYEHILRERAGGFAWVAFIDADEFIVPTSSSTDFSKSLSSIPGDVGAVMLNWACFGSSGKERFENRPVVERFIRRAHADTDPQLNFHYKSIVRPEATLGTAGNPHQFMLQEGFRYARINGVTPESFGMKGGKTGQVDWNDWRINHYLTKSWSEFYHRKMPKGRSDRPELARTAAYFFKHDVNDQMEPFPPELASRLQSEVDAVTRQMCGADSDLAPVLEGFAVPEAPPKKFFDWSRSEPGDVKARTAWRRKPVSKFVSKIQILLWEYISRR